MITDGQVHDAPSGKVAAQLAAPLHVLLTGERNEGDRVLTVVDAPSYGLVNKPLDLTVRVDDLPGPSRGQARVTLRRDGGNETAVTVPLGEDTKLPVTLDHAGQSIFEVSVEQGPHALTLVNKRAVVVVNGVRDRLRVLLISGEPHPGERAWRNLLKSDPSVDLVHFTILRPPEKLDATPVRELSLITFPVHELFDVKLNEFDLIIFDRYRRRGELPNNYLQNIADYVNRGGALLGRGGARLRLADQHLLYPARCGDAGRAHGPGPRARLPPGAHRHRQAPPGDRRAPRGRRCEASVGPLVPRDRHSPQGGGDPHDRARQPGTPPARARRQGARGAHRERSDVAVVARVRGRGTRVRALAPARPLAHAGARARGGGAQRPSRRQQAQGRAPEPRSQAGRGRDRGPLREDRQARPHPRRGGALPRAA